MKRFLLPLVPLLAFSSTLLAQRSQQHSGFRRSSTGAPEIDSALAGTAIALVVGGLLVITSARRRKLART